MTLENLLSIGRLHPHKATATEIRRLLAAAEAALADAGRSPNSAATRDSSRVLECIHTITKAPHVPIHHDIHPPGSGREGAS